MPIQHNDKIGLVYLWAVTSMP